MSAALTIAALKAAPAPMGTIDYEKGDPDAPLLARWNQRQQLLAEIEALGRFYDADDNCHAKSLAFSIVESSIPRMPCLTAKGLIAKLWVALAHRGPYIANEELRAESDAIRRADFDEVAAFEDRLDFDQAAIFRAICDIRHWLQFEQVGYLPQRRAA